MLLVRYRAVGASEGRYRRIGAIGVLLLYLRAAQKKRSFLLLSYAHASVVCGLALKQPGGEAKGFGVEIFDIVPIFHTV